MFSREYILKVFLLEFRGAEVAVGGAAVLPVVMLVIVLGWPECLVYGGVFRCLDGCRSQECVDLMAAAAQQCHHVLRSVSGTAGLCPGPDRPAGPGRVSRRRACRVPRMRSAPDQTLPGWPRNVRSCGI